MRRSTWRPSSGRGDRAHLELVPAVRLQPLDNPQRLRLGRIFYQQTEASLAAVLDEYHIAKHLERAAAQMCRRFPAQQQRSCCNLRGCWPRWWACKATVKLEIFSTPRVDLSLGHSRIARLSSMPSTVSSASMARLRVRPFYGFHCSFQMCKKGGGVMLSEPRGSETERGTERGTSQRRFRKYAQAEHCRFQSSQVVSAWAKQSASSASW